MRILYILVVIVLSLYQTVAQIKVETDGFSNWWVDNHGNIFVQSDSEVLKINNKGEVLAKWSSPKSNTIQSFDARDNMRILIFFQESYQIQYLDRNLVEISGPLDLSNTVLSDIIAISQSTNGGLWVADRQTNIVYSLNNNFTTNYSFPFSRFGMLSDVKKIVEYDQQLWFLMSDNNWITLDFFGQKLGNHHNLGLEKAQISKSKVHYVSAEKLYVYDINLRESTLVPSFEPLLGSVFIYNNNLYCFDNKDVIIKNLK